MFNELRLEARGESKEAPPCRPTSPASPPSASLSSPTSPPSAASAAIVPRSSESLQLRFSARVSQFGAPTSFVSELER